MLGFGLGKRSLPELGGPTEFDAVGEVGPEVEVSVQGGVVEGNTLTGKSFDETVELHTQVSEVVAREEPTKVSVERMVTVLSIAKEEGGFADGVAGLVKRVLGEKGAKDGFPVIPQGPEFPENGKGLVTGRGAPVASEGGAVAPMLVIEGGDEPCDVGGVVGFFVSGHDEVKVGLLVGRLVFVPLVSASDGEPA